MKNKINCIGKIPRNINLCDSISKDHNVKLLKKSKVEGIEYYSKICNDGKNIYTF